MTSPPTLFSLAAAALGVFPCSCASPEVTVTRRPQVASPEIATLLDADKLTAPSREYLGQEDLQAVYRRDPSAVIATLRDDLAADPSSSPHRGVLVELCSDTGTRLADSEPRKALGFFLSAAELAMEGAMAMDPQSAGHQERIAAYNNSAGKIAEILSASEHPWGDTVRIEGPGKTFRLTCRPGGPGRFDPTFIDKLTPADHLKFKDIELERIPRAGWGAAMVGHRNATPERLKKDPFLPPAGMSVAVTATLEFAGGARDVLLTLHDVMNVESARLGGRTVTLSADLTAPLASLYNFAPKHNVGWAGMLHPDAYADKTGLFQFEPYQSEKIPVVLVHGLMSSPGTWVKTINRLRADPKLRSRYQVLAFYYPTGFPIGYNSAALRSSLKEFQKKFDPDGRNPLMRKTVLIGHSMGGLLSNAQVRNSGDILMEKVFTKPIDDVEGLSSDQKDALRALLVYEANPDVTRMIFIAAPHRGSDLASHPIGQLGSRLIKIPSNLIAGERIPDVAGMTDLGHWLVTSKQDGIEELDPNAPALLAMLEEPMAGWITPHSVIGNKNPDGPPEGSSDGVVPYWSSHLDRIQSEKIVHATHTTITRNNDAIEEVRRILYLHAGVPYHPNQHLNGTPPPPPRRAISPRPHRRSKRY